MHANHFDKELKAILYGSYHASFSILVYHVVWHIEEPS
jgi:hypothetical protein